MAISFHIGGTAVHVGRIIVSH